MGDRPRHFAIPIITKGRSKKRFFGLDIGAQHGDVTGTIDDDEMVACTALVSNPGSTLTVVSRRYVVLCFPS